MNKITINLNDHNSEIYVGMKWNDVKSFLPSTNTVIITDDNLYRIYGEGFPSFPVFCIKPGEESKKIETIADLAVKLLNTGIDRSGFILGIGGGVVCDITGFLASVYMRGIKFGFISTSLLSQVDASVGGKNAVNIGGAKNILGCFSQPEFVICDPEMLKTLPADEYISGLSELIKMGLIMDKALFTDIEQNVENIINRNTTLLEYLISVSLSLKSAVVMEDEKETSGERMILNFGHTFGHVIETVAGLKHGYAVASGMVISADMSVQKGMLNLGERDRIRNLLQRFGLLKEYNIPQSVFEGMIMKDKKKQGNDINFVLLESPGKAVVRKMSLQEIMTLYNILYGKS
ncbi:MAG: 3-dehydroquinate synthase [Bacteroidales bacterium]|nr:3-dehydroquinate synthase [Bacteroidales bacterium]